MNFEIFENKGKIVKSWTKGVLFEEGAKKQVFNMTELPFISSPIAIMPDVHGGKGAVIGSVIPTVKAIIPSAVGVDIGCGMIAVRTSLTASDLPDSLFELRSDIENEIPTGVGANGSWNKECLESIKAWKSLITGFNYLCDDHCFLTELNPINQLGTLGSGNHFIEICVDEHQNVWVMIHSGSRGVGNKIGTHYIDRAKKEMERWFINLPDKDLAYIPEGSEYFNRYVYAVNWAQDFAKKNREVMMELTLKSISKVLGLSINYSLEAINCHHNYINQENHFGKNMWITRKGAVRARKGEMGIIPGSMGAKSFIVRGLGNPESYCSCSHGAGRVMSRTEAKRRVSLSDHLEAVKNVECRKDASIIDETPSAYKDIQKVMEAQSDLVEIVYTLKQVLCIKGN